MYIYCWQDRRYYAIAISKGAHPEERMYNYANAAQLIVRHGTLCSYQLQRGTNAKDILDAVHGSMKALDLRQIEGHRELFTLKGNLYEPIAAAVMRAAAAAEREWRLERFGPEPEARQGDRARPVDVK